MTNPIDLAVGPPTTYLHLKPGTTSSQRLVIEQKGSLVLDITPSLVDFASDGKTGQPALKDTSTFRYATLTLPNDASPQADSHTFTLTPQQKKNISVNFDIPSNATEGEYPLTILFRAKPSEATTIGAGESEVSAVVGSNIIVLISKSGKDQSQLTLEKIDSMRFIDSLMPLSFTITAKNDGGNASTASGSATISDSQQHQLAEFPFYPDMVLANSTRQLRTTPSLEKAAVDPSLITSVFNYKSWFLIGQYTIQAKLENTTSNQNTDSELTQTVIALPFSFVIVAILCLAVWRFFLLLNTKKVGGEKIQRKSALDEPI